jgi:hypothetical protein
MSWYDGAKRAWFKSKECEWGERAVLERDCNHKSVSELAGQWDRAVEQLELGGGEQLMAMTLVDMAVTTDGYPSTRCADKRGSEWAHAG